MDDNQFPQPVQGLSGQQEREILQLWLVHDPSDELEDEQAFEQTELPSKKVKTHYDNIHLCFANVTSFGRKVQNWIWSKGDHTLFLQETHLNEKKLQEVQQYCVVRGWTPLGVRATDTGRGGTTGGFLCLYPPQHHVHGLQHFIKEGNGGMAGTACTLPSSSSTYELGRPFNHL